MIGYIARRVVAAFLVIVAASMIVFAIFFLGPTNAAQAICDESGRCTPEKMENIESSLGLDKPVVQQYGVWAKGLFTGRTIQAGATYECSAPCLGISFTTKNEVTDELVQKFPATLSVALGGTVVFLLLGVPTGVLAAKYRGMMADRGLVTSSLLISSVPYYLFALLAWLFLVNSWGIFPETGYFPITEDPVKWFTGLLLPWLVVGIYYSTTYARFTRGFMIDSLGEDYVRTAAAKGLSSNKVIFKHGLRAAIVPIITILGLDIAGLLTGTIFTERIFEIDGIGNWSFQALPNNFPVIAAGVLVSAVLIVVANLVVDVIYSVIDPRVRLA